MSEQRYEYSPEFPQGRLVPLTAAELAQRATDAANEAAAVAARAARDTTAAGCRDELRARRARLSDLAARVTAGTVTAAEQRELIALQARLLDRLARLVLSDLDAGA